tara:strand:- start:23664 stop:24590 length:927 start_codon:yes stop_codon:yes gene_type:complete
MANFYITEADWNKIQHYCRYAWDEYSSEIGGMMLAQKDKEGKWKLFKPSILKQTISGGNTVLEKEALSHYYVEMGKKYANKNVQLVWWHSHHTMAAFWSGTDLTAIDEMSNGEMSISLVVNLKEEYKLRVNLWKPYPMYLDTELDILRKTDKKKVPKAISSEVDTLCEKPKPTIYTTHNRGSQMALWSYQNNISTTTNSNDQEMIDLEAKVDDIITDFCWNRGDKIPYRGYKKNMEALNKGLKDNKSELRVAILEADQLEQCAMTLPADKYIYINGKKWSFEDALIEAEMDEYNYSYTGGRNELNSKI